jgi:hypothetical protein
MLYLLADYSCLFRRNELEERFDGWTILESRTQTFPAPEDTRQGFFDRNHGKTDSKELKSSSIVQTEPLLEFQVL